MPIAQISNPLGINAAQGNEVYTSPTIIPFGADPAGNANTITWMTTANPTVITTTAAHGFITGKQVLVNTSTAFVATGTLPTAAALRLHGPERDDVLDPVQLHRDLHLRWSGLPELPARSVVHPSELERYGLRRSLSPRLPDRGDTAADHRLQGSGRCHHRLQDPRDSTLRLRSTGRAGLCRSRPQVSVRHTSMPPHPRPRPTCRSRWPRPEQVRPSPRPPA